MLREIRGIFNSELLGENVIIAQIKIYNETKKYCPGDDPHALIAKTLFSRFRARGIDIENLGVQMSIFSMSVIPSCLREGHNIEFAATLALSDERPDIMERFPKFGANADRLVQPLIEDISNGKSISEIYGQMNKNLQIKYDFPPVYEMIFEGYFDNLFNSSFNYLR